MTRPCFLVIDREHSGSISTRKLVIETAKFNVITAYSGAEAIAMLERFPAVDGIVLDASLPDIPCTEVVHALKRVCPEVPTVLIGSPRSGRCEGADHELETFDPERLLDLLRRLLPDRAEQVQKQDEQLRERE